LSLLVVFLLVNAMTAYTRIIEKLTVCHFTDSVCGEDPHDSNSDGGSPDKSVELIGSEATSAPGTLQPA